MSTITRLEFKNGAKKENKYIKNGAKKENKYIKNGANFVIMEHMEQI